MRAFYTNGTLIIREGVQQLAAQPVFTENPPDHRREPDRRVGRMKEITQFVKDCTAIFGDHERTGGQGNQRGDVWTPPCSPVVYFAQLDVAHGFVESLRWPQGVTCIRCGSMRVTCMKTTLRYRCNDCRDGFSVRTGTILQNNTSIYKWLCCIWELSISEKYISYAELGRRLGVADVTARYMMQKVEAAKTHAYTPSQRRKRTWRAGREKLPTHPRVHNSLRTRSVIAKAKTKRSLQTNQADLVSNEEGLWSESTHDAAARRRIKNRYAAMLRPALEKIREATSELEFDCIESYYIGGFSVCAIARKHSVSWDRINRILFGTLRKDGTYYGSVLERLKRELAA